MERLIGTADSWSSSKEKTTPLCGKGRCLHSKNMRTVEHYHRTAELSSGMRSQRGKGVSAPTSCWSWCWLLIKTFRVLLCWLLKTSEDSFPTMSLDFCSTAGWSLNSRVPGVCQIPINTSAKSEVRGSLTPWKPNSYGNAHFMLWNMLLQIQLQIYFCNFARLICTEKSHGTV